MLHRESGDFDLLKGFVAPETRYYRRQRGIESAISRVSVMLEPGLQ